MNPLPEQAKMVGWFKPAQLVRTAIEVLVSSTLGRHTDRRLIEALATSEPLEAFDCSKEMDYGEGSFWVDYIADTGDGWDAVYAVAYAAAQETLTVKGIQGEPYHTERGRVLVLGGDQVYPIAARAEYAKRFAIPFATAFPSRQTAFRACPKMFAIPGNHDWYDSLASFTRLFCQGRAIGGWHAPQRRSYFAIKLPHGWWLLGTDVQLAADIDEPQVQFFRKIASQFQPADRVILCNAEPQWVNAAVYGNVDPEYNENNLRFLEEKVLHGKVAVFIAGDLHHYRRHAGPGNIQKITAGGGGAFLHPTHPDDHLQVLRENDDRDREFLLKKSFPTVEESRRLCWGNLLFLFKNPEFGVVTAVLYVMLSGAARGAGGSVLAMITHIVITPFSAFIVGCTLAGFIFFTDTHSRPYKFIAGGLHGLANVSAALSIAWWALYLTGDFLEPWRTLISAAITAAGGWIAGPIIMGLYLLISLNVFGRHYNEAFSALAIKDFRNFLRMKIDSDGALTIFPIGIRRVPRRWKRGDGGGSGVVPDDPRATAPELIEDPIILIARQGSPGSDVHQRQ